MEEFFQYHGIEFLSSMEKLMEDVIERSVSQMLTKLEFRQDSTTGNMKVSSDSLREYEKITQENIDLDISAILHSAVNSEIINQRKMAKQQYLESQGFNGAGSSSVSAQTGMQNNMQPQIQQAQGQYGQAQQYQQQGQQAMNQGQQAMNNGSGYPIPPSGQDNYGRPYWIEPTTGQMSYEPPQSGLHLAQKAQKLAAWGKWLM